MTDYALIERGQIVRIAQFPTGEQPALSPEKGLAWLEFIDTPRPAFDPIIEGVRPAPLLIDSLQCRRQWEVFPMPSEASANLASAAESARVANLWQGAHDTEFAAISGSAVGLVTLGVLQGKPKCLAVMAWIQALWATYYQRKASGSDDADYTACGACPHTVPELMAELGL